MRRSDKEITERTLVEAVIYRSQVCRIALCDGNMPYIVPMCFGYMRNALYLHSAKEGKKIDIIKRNNNVCFEFDIDLEAVKSENPCSWAMKYQSVIGYGKATFVDDPESKRAALDIIMKQYTDAWSSFPDQKLENIAIIKIDITELSGKKSGE